MIGTRSADYIKASGYERRTTGRTHDLHPTASRKPKESLDPWAPSTQDPKQRHLGFDIEPMHFPVDGDGDHGDTWGAVFARGGRPASGIRTRRIVL
jgi:hypothetical protein